MKRCLLLLTLLLLPGCDVAVAALLFSSNDSSDDDPAPLTSPFGPNAKIWLADIPDDAAATIERANLVGAGGKPDSSLWIELDTLQATSVFDPDPPIVFNTILIEVSPQLNFNIDAIEVLDASNNVIGFAEGQTFASFTQPESEILGAPDGICAVTSASGSVHAFIFTRYTSVVVDRFRVNARGVGQPPLPGDVLAQGGGLPQFGENHLPGGMSVDANGIVYLTNTRGDTAHLTLFNVGALVLPETTEFSALSSVQIAPNLAAAGSHSVVANATGGYTACSVTTGIIRVQRWDVPNPANSPVAGAFREFNSTASGDRVEPNGIALDSSGNVVVVGGWGSTLSGRNHFRVKMPATVTGTVIWQSPVPAPALDTSSTTYWHAVTTVGDETLMTGDLFNGSLFSGTNQIYTSLFDTTGQATMDDSYPAGESGADLGHAIATDSAGNIYVGGYVTTGADARNGILVRYEPDFGTARDTTIIGAAGGDDEILDIAVDTDGSIFVVGFTTTVSEGQNWFVRKYRYNTTVDAFEIPPVWERTHDGSDGNDQAVSVVLTGNYVVVAGFETESAVTVIKIRVYAK